MHVQGFSPCCLAAHNLSPRLFETGLRSKSKYPGSARQSGVTWALCAPQKFAAALIQLSVAVGLVATVALRPYTVDAPKKILLQHLHVQV
jgi:hypothetical protein